VKKPKITAVICTYNRAELVKECLLSLIRQSASKEDFEILLVDNNSTDATREVAEEIGKQCDNFRYIFEPINGSSQARNTGWQNTRTDWIIYLDDDAKAKENLIERALWLLENHSYEVIGGVYLPWYKYGRPRWYKDQYGSNKKKYTSLHRLTGNQTLASGVMIVKKSLHEQYGGFSTDLGMKGKVIGYGEEVELQYRFRSHGVQTIYDPELVIYHVVAPYKLNVGWFFKSAFAGGRDQVVSGKIKKNNFNLFLIAVVAVGMILVNLIRFTPRLLSKNYYIENWMLDVFRKVAKRVGMLYTALLDKYGEKN
jgi:glycosyltransferase involved in cell wall biosynthesis